MAQGKERTAQFYELLDSTEGSKPRPGVFFYAPIFYEPRIFGVVRPYQPRRGGVDFELKYNPVPADIFKTAGLPGFMEPGEEVLMVPAKRRPVVIISPEHVNQEQALVVPCFTLRENKFEDDELAKLRANELAGLFFLPEDPATGIHDSFLDMDRIQPILLNDYSNPGIAPFKKQGAKMVAPAGHKFFSLSEQYLGEFQTMLKEYLSLK